MADVDLDDLKVVDNPGESRFEVRVGDEAAFVEYRSTSSAIAYIHTEVPDSWRGRGVAARLAKHALDFARAEGLLHLIAVGGTAQHQADRRMAQREAVTITSRRGHLARGHPHGA